MRTPAFNDLVRLRGTTLGIIDGLLARVTRVSNGRYTLRLQESAPGYPKHMKLYANAEQVQLADQPGAKP